MFVAVPSVKIPLDRFHAFVPMDIPTTITFKSVFSPLQVAERLIVPSAAMHWDPQDLTANVQKDIKYLLTPALFTYYKLSKKHFCHCRQSLDHKDKCLIVSLLIALTISVIRKNSLRQKSFQPKVALLAK